PDILKWARERSGYAVEAIATFLKKDASIVNDWEAGESVPTYIQLEKLADKYKRPIALFFFPEPPDEPNIAEHLEQGFSMDSYQEKIGVSNVNSGNLRNLQ
ncbi:helix-turn-helix domain-containing protein, partial [Candidatus Poribacteria bacterium]|nr:helix-turn-helix domain-containing protein [Candidatus Poribacteria bacterium]